MKNKKQGCLKQFGIGFAVLMAAAFVSNLIDGSSSSSANAPKEAVREEARDVKLSDAELAKFKKLINEDYDVWLGEGESLFGSYTGTLVTTGSKIALEYEKNEVRATRKYKGNLIAIKGRVVSIETGFGDRPYVVIASNRNYGFNNPQLRFSRGDKDYPVTLDKGDIKIFVCKGDSEVAGTPMLKECYSKEAYRAKLNKDVIGRVNYYIAKPEKVAKETKEAIKDSGSTYSSAVDMMGLAFAAMHLGVEEQIKN